MSRMKYLEITRPDKVAMINVVNNIYQGIVSDSIYGCLLEERLPKDTLDLLVELEPRFAKKLLEEACMRAISLDRSLVMPNDIGLTSMQKNNPLDS